MDECPFCKIASGKIPADKVYEDSSILAFLDINPRNPGHTLVMPKKHYETIMEMPEAALSDLSMIVKKVAIAAMGTMKAEGVSVNQSNGRAAGQVIPHVHFHIIPRYLSEGPPGLESILPVKKLPPETLRKMAELVRAGMKTSYSPKLPVVKRQEKEDDDIDSDDAIEIINEDEDKPGKKDDIDFNF